MAIVQIGINAYTVYLHGGPHGSSGRFAYITFSSPKISGQLQFFLDSATIPANSKSVWDDGTQSYQVSFRYSQYAGIIDLLRNENPVYLVFDEDKLTASIVAGGEPVGEGE